MAGTSTMQNAAHLDVSCWQAFVMSDLSDSNSNLVGETGEDPKMHIGTWAKHLQQKKSSNQMPEHTKTGGWEWAEICDSVCWFRCAAGRMKVRATR